MARHMWTIMCSKSSIDRQTNNLSLFDIIEKIDVAVVAQVDQIIVPIPFHLVTMWVRSAQLRKGCRVFCGTGAGPAHE